MLLEILEVPDRWLAGVDMGLRPHPMAEAGKQIEHEKCYHLQAKTKTLTTKLPIS